MLPGEIQHVPLDQYKANVSKLINFVRSPHSAYYSADTKIIIITPTPIIESIGHELLKADRATKGIPAEDVMPTRRTPVTKRYASACYDLAKKEGLPVVDMHTAIIEAAGGDGDEQLEPYFTYVWKPMPL